MKPGKAYAAVAVKDLRPLSRRACSRVLDRDPRSGWVSSYGSVPAPCFETKPNITRRGKLCARLTESIHFRND